MKKRTKLTAIFLAAIMLLCGCEKIADNSDASDSESSSTSSDTGGEQPLDTFLPKEYTVMKTSYVSKLEAEKGSFSGTARDKRGEELQHPDMGGYVEISKGQHLTQVATVPTAQFYRVIISARSENGASIKLRVGEAVEGSYYVPPRDEADEGALDGDGYGLFAVDNLYMSVGLNSLNLTVEDGAADIDYLIVEDSAAVSADIYRTGSACVSPNASSKTVELMTVLSENFGKYTFTAQNVSCGTNVEIDTIYNETQRYPAIRVSELALAMKDDAHSAETVQNDIEAARKWNREGGICAYTWHWYSPNAIRGVERRDYDIHTVMLGIEPSELALLDDEAIQLQLENELITQDAVDLLADIDLLAKTLKPLSDSDIPILFEPIPDGDAGLFWWGADADSYKSLWILIFDRLIKYNDIKNLIWVWNNSDFDYYPGDEYIDIIGQSFYERSNSSFAGRFSALGSDIRTGRKMLAVTACDVLPSVDFMARDNAMWLWTAADSGEYIIDRTGRYSEMYNPKAVMRGLYNNEKCITRDELKALFG